MMDCPASHPDRGVVDGLAFTHSLLAVAQEGIVGGARSVTWPRLSASRWFHRTLIAIAAGQASCAMRSGGGLAWVRMM